VSLLNLLFYIFCIPLINNILYVTRCKIQSCVPACDMYASPRRSLRRLIRQPLHKSPVGVPPASPWPLRRCQLSTRLARPSSPMPSPRSDLRTFVHNSLRWPLCFGVSRFGFWFRPVWRRSFLAGVTYYMRPLRLRI
jgi:hypothetical protein